MQTLTEILYETQNVTASVADKAKGQFRALCDQAAGNLSTNFTAFSRTDNRLDHFYYSIIGNDTDSSELWSVVKMILILSHGNASVESGFSINGSILVENMHEESVVAQRLVYDAVQAGGGVMNINIDKSMLQFVRGSRARYNHYMDDLQRKREQHAEEVRRNDERKRAALTIKTLKMKKAKVMQAAAAEASAIDSDIVELEKCIK